MPKFIARDPAIWLTVVATAVRLLGAFVIHLSTDQQAVLNAAATAVAGVLVAFLVARDGQVAAILGLCQALLALAIGFGLKIDAEGQAVIMSFAGAVAAAFVRTQVTASVSADGAKQVA